MDMLLGNMNPHANGHESVSAGELPSDRLSLDQHCYPGPEKGRD